MKSNIRWYFCRHCGKRFATYYMEDICFQLDLKKLEYEKSVLSQR